VAEAGRSDRAAGDVREAPDRRRERRARFAYEGIRPNSDGAVISIAPGISATTGGGTAGVP